MNIKSAYGLRKYIQVESAGDTDERTDCNFIGSYHGSRKTGPKGFFQVMHGLKDDIPGMLQGFLKIAEDEQAIYEFIQNAVDSDASQFWVFYDKNYFLAINNGKPFTRNQIESVLNLAQSEKRKIDENDKCDKIGRFGIGFKLVHRLVGQNDGGLELTELQDGVLKGPVLFSWSNYQSFSGLLQNSLGSSISEIDEESGALLYEESPWLFKMLLTNFPAAPGEKLKDIDYQDFVPFPMSELEEFSQFANSSLGDLATDGNVFNQGSAFFIKLGEGKFDLLERESQKLETGVNYSMHFFKKLEQITVNNHSITKQPLKWLNYEIDNGSEEFQQISPEYNACPIKMSFGYSDDLERIKEFRNQPNFYKYFPVGDEVNSQGYIVNCDAFDIESNRRKLQSTSTNRLLIDALSTRLLGYLEKVKNDRHDEYRSLFLSLLYSNSNQANFKNELTDRFYSPLRDFISQNVPTSQGGVKPSQMVRVKNFEFPLELKEVGLSELCWLAWDGNSADKVWDRASEELSLGVWRLWTVVYNAPEEDLYTYLKKLDFSSYCHFIRSLRKDLNIVKLTSHLRNIRFIRTHAGEIVSLEEVRNRNIFLLAESNIVLFDVFRELDKDVVNGGDELIDIITSLNSNVILGRGELIAFLHSSETKLNLSRLDSTQRFLLKSFVGSDHEMSKSIPLFFSNARVLRPLTLLVEPLEDEISKWLSPFVILEQDFEVLSEAFIDELIRKDELLERFFLNKTLFKDFASSLNREDLNKVYSELANLVQSGSVEGGALRGALAIGHGELSSLMSLAGVDIYCTEKLSDYPKPEYDNLAKCLELLSNRAIPVYEYYLLKDVIEDFYSETIDFSLEDGERVTLTIEEFDSFSNWLQTEGRSDVLGNFRIKVENELVHFTGASDVKYYHSEDNGLVAFIEEYNQGEFEQFPSELWQLGREEIGVLINHQLIQTLVEFKVGGQDLARFISEDLENDVILDFLESIEEIQIDSPYEYPDSSSTFHVIRLAATALKSAEEEVLSSFRSKVLIDGEPLTEKVISSEIFFVENTDFPEYKAPISLIDVLPVQNHEFKIDQILNCFERIDVDHLFARETKSPKAILEELEEMNLELLTPAQAFFVTLCNTYILSLEGHREIDMMTEAEEADGERASNIALYLEYLFQYYQSTTERPDFYPFEGFRPLGLNLDSEFALESEKPPQWLFNWIDEENKDERVSFLKELGISDSDSSINKLRRAVKAKESLSGMELSSIDNATLLVNSLQWMSSLEEGQRVYQRDDLVRIFDRLKDLLDSWDNVPIPSKVDLSGKLNYRLVNPKDEDRLFLIQDQWTDYGSEIANFVDSHGYFVDDIYSSEKYEERWEILEGEIQNYVEEEVINQCSSFDESFYIDWEDRDQLKILVFPREMVPVSLKIDEEVVGVKEKSSYYEEGLLIVAESKLANIIGECKDAFGKSARSLFNSLKVQKDDFESIAGEGEKSHRVEEMTLSDEQISKLKAFFNDDLSEDDKKNWNLIALVSALEELPVLGYNIDYAKGNLEESRMFAQIEPVFKDEVPLTIMVRSGLRGLLYLSASAWSRLDEEDVELYVQVSRSNGKLFGTKDEVCKGTAHTDYQLIRVESQGDARSIDQILTGKIEEKGKVWLTFLLDANNENYGPLFYENYLKRDYETLKLENLSEYGEDAI